jgi:hypothetical protein
VPQILPSHILLENINILIEEAEEVKVEEVEVKVEDEVMEEVEKI